MLNKNDAAHPNYDLRATGNWRLIQDYNTQGLKQIGEPLDCLAGY